MNAGFEDEYYDVLRKARAGLGLSPAAVGEKAGTGAAAVLELERGPERPDLDALRKVAKALGISPAGLAELACATSVPPVTAPPGLAVIPPSGGCANTYILSSGDESVAVDPGGSPDDVLSRLGNTRLTAILVTHGHHDHTGGVAGIIRRFRVPVVVLEGENVPVGGATGVLTPVRPGHLLRCGSIGIRVLAVPGHTPGHAAYHSEEARVAFTGDALFARSLGGACGSGKWYADFIRSVKSGILGLPAETVLCPGHGPLTTVAAELAANPFVA